MQSVLKIRLGACWLATAAAMASPPASAASFSVSGQPPASGGGQGTCTSGSLTSAAPTTFAGGCSGSGIGISNGSAFATFGHIGARSYAETYAAITLGAIWESTAGFTDQLIFSSDVEGALFADVALNIALSGLLQGRDGTIHLSHAVGPGNASVEGFARIHDRSFRFSDGTYSPTNLGEFALVSGAFGDVTSGLLRTPTVRVPLNVPVAFEFGIFTRAGVHGAGGSALSDFDNSLEVPIGSDAFVLGSGVTVNSGSWLVNNRRIVDAIPEPATWAMMIGGFGLVGGAMRRRARSYRYVTV